MRVQTILFTSLALIPSLTTAGFWNELELDDVIAINATTANDVMLFKEDHSFERCPVGQHSDQKYNDKPDGPNGCGPGSLAGLIPGSKMFKQCCYSHDICFETCHVQTMHYCAYNMEQCMSDICHSLGGVKKVACVLLKPWYVLAINGGTAAKIWHKNTVKHCDCTNGPAVGPGTGIPGKDYKFVKF